MITGCWYPDFVYFVLFEAHSGRSDGWQCVIFPPEARNISIDAWSDSSLSVGMVLVTPMEMI